MRFQITRDEMATNLNELTQNRGDHHDCWNVRYLVSPKREPTNDKNELLVSQKYKRKDSHESGHAHFESNHQDE